MYDRANRDLVQICGSTNEQVGPGTYDNDVLDPKKLRAGVFMLSPCLYVVVLLTFSPANYTVKMIIKFNKLYIKDKDLFGHFV